MEPVKVSSAKASQERASKDEEKKSRQESTLSKTVPPVID